MINVPIDTNFEALYAALYHLHRDDIAAMNAIKALEVKSVIQKHQSTRWNYWREQMEDLANLREGFSSEVPLTAGKSALELMDTLKEFMKFDNIHIFLGDYNFIKISFGYKGDKYTISVAPNGSSMLYQGPMQSPDQKVFNARDNAQAVKTLRKWVGSSKKKRKQEKKARKKNLAEMEVK